MRLRVIAKGAYRYLPYQFGLAKSLRDHKAYVPPKQVQVEITNSCNLRCIMCDRWRWAEEGKETKDTLSTENLFSLFKEFSKMGVEGVLLTGGETLIRKDFVALVNSLRDLGLFVTIFTNGTLMDREKAEALVAAQASVFFSVDGVSRTHDHIRGAEGTFEKAVQGIEEIIQARRRLRGQSHVMINFTFQKENAGEVVPIFRKAQEIGADTVAYNLVHGKPDVAPDEGDLRILREGFSELMRLQKNSKTHVSFGDALLAFIEGTIPVKNVQAGLPAVSLFRSNPVPCLSAYTFSFVDSFGRVFPCCYCYLDNFSFRPYEDMRRRFCMGNVLDGGFEHIWHGEKYNRFRADTDPIDMGKLGQFCGQCYDYFGFEKRSASFPFFRKIKQQN